MNHSVPVRAIVVPSVAAVFDEDKPGTVCIKPGDILYAECPCGCGSHMRLPIHPDGTTPANTTRPSWSYNGNPNSPTLKPSIRDMAGCRFHGHLTDGMWTFETDSGVVA